MSLLEVRSLSKSIGPAKILKGIDLTVERGEILGLIGPTGSESLRITVRMRSASGGTPMAMAPKSPPGTRYGRGSAGSRDCWR